jgi:hypothetical protein
MLIHCSVAVMYMFLHTDGFQCIFLYILLNIYQTETMFQITIIDITAPLKRLDCAVKGVDLNQEEFGLAQAIRLLVMLIIF